jgi:hypothetical protein
MHWNIIKADDLWIIGLKACTEETDTVAQILLTLYFRYSLSFQS